MPTWYISGFVTQSFQPFIFVYRADATIWNRTSANKPQHQTDDVMLKNFPALLPAQDYIWAGGFL